MKPLAIDPSPDARAIVTGGPGVAVCHWLCQWDET
jgi:hypothetical protein